MSGLPHHHVPQVGSTITASWDLAEAGADVPFWLTADEQLAGRGRGGRLWSSKPGNLYSTYLGPAPTVDGAALLPFAVALAVHDAIAPALPEQLQPALRLKWPNDVLHDGAKIAGILIEKRQGRVAIGIGINVAHAPQIPGRRTIGISALGAPANVSDIFEALTAAMAKRLTQLDTRPQTIGPAWTAKAVGVGAPVVVDRGEETWEGTFDHLAADGALMLRVASGAMRPIYAGDLFISDQSA
ncbi:MAG: biotin--[acetyl-CoA-carboxylase] ligase [Pseudomonadota bacterium]